MDDREPLVTLAGRSSVVLAVVVLDSSGGIWQVVAKREVVGDGARPEKREMVLIYARNVQVVAELDEELGHDQRSRERSRGECCRSLLASSLEPDDVRLEVRALKRQDLAGAQRFIHMQYFIWERDELTAELVDILLDRVKAGVEVRILNDFLGNIQYKKDELKALKDAGAQVGLRRRGSIWASSTTATTARSRSSTASIGHTGGVQHRSGVHRRRQDVPRVARHRHPRHRPGGRGARRSCSRRAGGVHKERGETCSTRSTSLDPAPRAGHT